MNERLFIYKFKVFFPTKAYFSRAKLLGVYTVIKSLTPASDISEIIHLMEQSTKSQKTYVCNRSGANRSQYGDCSTM